MHAKIYRQCLGSNEREKNVRKNECVGVGGEE